MVPKPSHLWRREHNENGLVVGTNYVLAVSVHLD